MALEAFVGEDGTNVRIELDRNVARARLGPRGGREGERAQKQATGGSGSVPRTDGSGTEKTPYVRN